MNSIRVYFKALEHAGDIAPPSYESEEAAGMDVRAAVSEPLTLKPGERRLIPTGYCMALPSGYEAQIRPRSGLAYRKGITMLNTPGTIDSDYRGELKVLAINHGNEPFTVRRGDRVAQMVIAPVYRADIETVEKLPSSERGSGGFGSTGVA